MGIAKLMKKEAVPGAGELAPATASLVCGPAHATVASINGPAPATSADKLQFYELIIARYKETIEKTEARTIPQMKQLVQPTNSHVAKFAETLKANPHPFKAAHEFVSTMVRTVPRVPVVFWASLSEVLEHKLATSEDKAILLCSIFRALGGDAGVIIAQLSDGSDRPLVLLAQNEQYLIFDPDKKHGFYDFSGTKEDALDKYTHDGKQIQRLLFEFDDKDYAQYDVE